MRLISFSLCLYQSLCEVHVQARQPSGRPASCTPATCLNPSVDSLRRIHLCLHLSLNLHHREPQLIRQLSLSLSLSLSFPQLATT